SLDLDIISTLYGPPAKPAPAGASFPAGHDRLTRPFAKTAQRLRNSSATPPSPPRQNATRLRVYMAAVVLCVLAVSARAHADDDPAAVEKVTKLNKKAVDEYQNLNFEEARKILRTAIDQCSQSGLDKHPVTARTYVHLGIVTFL